MTVLVTAGPLAHLGALHAYEQALVLLVAFGPFAVLGVVVAVLRRRDLAAERRGQRGGGEQRQEERSASQDVPT